MPVKSMKRTMNNQLQRGVSLVEALVALVILSVGMLGVAGLYLESLQANRTALSRTAAVSLVNDMADRIRANRAGLGTYALASGTAPGTASDCVAGPCTPAQIAQYDKVQWYTAVTTRLPNGASGTTLPRTSIVYTAAAGTTPARYVVRAAWNEAGIPEELSTSVEVMQLGAN
jgi:type IV pilus assembly protein PilV